MFTLFYLAICNELILIINWFPRYTNEDCRYLKTREVVYDCQVRIFQYRIFRKAKFPT